MGHVTRIPRQTSPAPDSDPRLRRLRRLAWLLDRSIGLGPNARFGLDPIIGLIPGLGDWLGSGLSLYVVYEAIRLGLPWSIITRMLGNVALETLVGSVPLAGDVFDFWWQANTRNLALVDRHYRSHHAPRSLRGVAALLIVLALVFIALTIGALFIAVWLLKALWQFVSG